MVNDCAQVPVFVREEHGDCNGDMVVRLCTPSRKKLFYRDMAILCRLPLVSYDKPCSKPCVPLYNGRMSSRLIWPDETGKRRMKKKEEASAPTTKTETHHLPQPPTFPRRPRRANGPNEQTNANTAHALGTMMLIGRGVLR